MGVVTLNLILPIFPLLDCTSKNGQSQGLDHKKKGVFFIFNKIKLTGG
jgi:hypothetical protein